MNTPSPLFSTIRVSQPAPGVTLCTFCRPEVRNALNLEMVGEIRQLLEQLTTDKNMRVLIFAGEGGKAFVSGADIAELHQRRREDALASINSSLFREIEQFPWPTIAAIDGFALGGGCELALACDMRLCSTRSRLGQPEVTLGIIPGAGATYRLPRLVGPGMAKELIFTGRIIDASTALEIGLVNRVVAAEILMETALTLATEISHNSPLALQLAKQAVNSSAESPTNACMTFESTAQAILFEDEEKGRRMTHFLEQRAKRTKSKKG